jgi:hypothetical protein
MYHIYHIPGVKIGCSTQPKQRVKTQGYSTFEILETHSDIYEASKREIELQKQYGYKVDDVPYNISYKNRHKWDDKSRILAAQSLERKVLQYDLQGKFVKEWKSIVDATKNIAKHNNSSLIRGVLRGDKPSAYGFMFRYKENNKFPLKIEPKPKRKLNNLTMISKTTCPHCGTTGQTRVMAQWHGDKCRKKSNP